MRSCFPPSARTLLCLLAACLCTPLAAQATPHTTTLADGQPITLHGTLQVAHRGWTLFVMLHTAQPYSFRFEPQAEAPAPTPLLQLIMDWQGITLAQHVGEAVTVTGTVLLNPSSGYYLNGAALRATQITLADGTRLQPAAAPTVPASITRYLVRITLDPHANLWARTAVALPSGRPLGSAPLDGCDTNGAGDLLNCGCSDGFAPTRAGRVAATAPLANNPRLPRVDDGLAQLQLPDAATHPITVQVLCTRQKADTR